MNRLTNKDINWYEDFVFSMRNRLITENEIKDSIYNRLKLLEDLEEDIGMSLLTLFKILKRGQIIYKTRSLYHHNKIILESRKIDGLYYDGSYYILKIHNNFEDDNENYDVVYVKDYGITWGITKKELENDK